MSQIDAVPDREFYVHLRDWIVETEVEGYRCGRVLEYVWHMIFGEPAVLSPVLECKLLYCADSDAARLPNFGSAVPT